MGSCFLCGEERETRRVFMGSARGFADLCIDCMVRFFKIRKDD